MNIKPQTEQALMEIASLKGVSLDMLLHDFVSKESRQLRERAEDDQRLAGARQNGGMTHDEMKSHFETLRDRARARL